MTFVVRSNRVLVAGWLLVSCLASQPARGQDASAMPMMNMNMTGWQFMEDGVLYAEVDHQGGPRGGTQFVAPNWWMGMATRSTRLGQFTFTTMLSLDPLTVGTAGYREIFQAGEALNGRPLIDRQHPHNAVMQTAGIWRYPFTSHTGLTLAAGPAGEAALGPVAFMHRASAADNPTAPLTHHTFDSTHISYGVITAAIDHGPWAVEASVFNGREPDQHRWNIELGPLDSVSGRIWFRPSPSWEFQASTGHLVHPEQLELGNIERTTASVSWTVQNGSSVRSITAGYGRNDSPEGSQSAVFLEAARHTGANTFYMRAEGIQAETTLLQTDLIVNEGLALQTSPVAAFTFGGVHDIIKWRGFEGGVGADVTLYDIPTALTPNYGAHPVSYHVFFRLRPPAGPMGRMWNMRMSQPMAGRQMGM